MSYLGLHCLPLSHKKDSLCVIWVKLSLVSMEFTTLVNPCHVREDLTSSVSSLFVCANPEGGQGVRTPPENNKNIGFLSNTGLDPLKNHKTSIQCWAIIGPSAKRHLNGVSLAGR